MFGAIVSMPLVVGAGVALDLSSISRVKSELQQAIDAAVLAVAREGDQISDQRAREIAASFLSNNLSPLHTNLVVTRKGTAVTVSAETTSNLAFGGLFGYDQFPIGTQATADIAYASYEIALVLDTTGSMKGGKLISMKDAVIGLVDTMSAQVKDDDKLKFSLVPFSSFVNVGPQFGPDFDDEGKQIAGTGAPWLDLRGEAPIAQTELSTGASRFQLYQNMGRDWSGCVETRMPGDGDYDVSDAAADRSEPLSLFVPAFAIDEPGKGGFPNDYIDADVDPLDTSARAQRQKWAKYGVATDASGRPLLGGLLSDVAGLLGGLLGGGDDDDEDEDDGDEGGGKVAKIRIDDSVSSHQGYRKGPEFGCVTQPITPLSNDYADIRDKVDDLAAQGTTNIVEGVAWGLRVLTPGEPFAEGKERSATGVEKIMIVLTDGANVLGNTNNKLKSAYTSYGYLYDGRLGLKAGSASDTNAAMNEKTLAACSYAKQEGVTVYTIRLEEPDVATGTMLKECASTPAHYFDAPSRRDLDAVFQSIRDNIVRVRLSS